MARVILNDQNIQLWDDVILMPIMLQAHLELQQKLKSRASPVMKAFANLIVNPYETILFDQPDDLTSPIKLWEKPLGAPDSAYQLMTETDELPFTSAANQLTWWAWVYDTILFVGSYLSIEVLVNYWRRVPVPTDPADLIWIIDGEQYLAPRIAAIAAGSVGETETSSVAGALAEAQLQIVLSGNRSRAPQSIGTSPHP